MHLLVKKPTPIFVSAPGSRDTNFETCLHLEKIYRGNLKIKCEENLKYEFIRSLHLLSNHQGLQWSSSTAGGSRFQEVVTLDVL